MVKKSFRIGGSGAGRGGRISVPLGTGIAAELKRDEAQQYRLACAGRADHHHVADIADMSRQAERRRAGGLGDEQRRATEVAIGLRPGPDR